MVFLAGPNPALPADSAFSLAHFEHVCQQYGDPAQLAKYDTYFVDSISVLARCASRMPANAVSDQVPAKSDLRAAYGLLAQKMIADPSAACPGQARHSSPSSTKAGRRPQGLAPRTTAAKTALSLPGIVDEVITLTALKTDEGEAYRAFVCQTLNWGCRPRTVLVVSFLLAPLFGPTDCQVRASPKPTPP